MLLLLLLMMTMMVVVVQTRQACKCLKPCEAQKPANRVKHEICQFNGSPMLAPASHSHKQPGATKHAQATDTGAPGSPWQGCWGSGPLC